MGNVLILSGDKKCIHLLNINHSRNTPEFKEHSLLKTTMVNINTEKYVDPINK